MGFANKEMACLETVVIKVPYEEQVNVMMVEQLGFEVHCVPGLAAEARKFYQGVLPFETATLEAAVRAEVLTGGKSLVQRSKRKKADVEAEVEQARAELCVCNARVAE